MGGLIIDAPTMYTSPTVLYEQDDGSFIRRTQAVDDWGSQWNKYTFHTPDQGAVGFIEGFFYSPTKFWIQQVKNESGKAGQGFYFIPRLYKTMEADLREQGVDRLLMTAYFSLVPFLIRRLGFVELREGAYDKVMSGWFVKHIPGMGIPLEKRLV